MNKLIYISFISLIVFSCKKPEDRACYKSTGNTISELRPLGDFTTIVLNDNIELKLNQSTENTATITSGENLINSINTEVSGDTLFISNENKCNNLRSRKHDITIDLNIVNVRKINHFGTKGLSSTNTLKSDTLSIESYDGHGDVTVDFEGDYLATIFHSGTCNVVATGVVNNSYAYQISNGYTDYSGLSANYSHLHSRTVQDCIISAKEKLSVEIHGSGDVYYKESSILNIELKRTGTGELISQ